MKEFTMSQFMSKESLYKAKSEYYERVIDQMKNCFNCQHHDGFKNGDHCICDDCYIGDVNEYPLWELSERGELLNALNEVKDEFPHFYKFAVGISRKTVIPSDTYNSMDFDNNSSRSYNSYIQVKNNRIVAIGEERGRDGGWYWFSKDKP